MEPTIKKIVCPVDFSDPSVAALKYARELAGHFSSELIFIHAISEIDPAASTAYALNHHLLEQIPQIMQQIKQSADEAMQKLIDTHIAGRVPAKQRVVIGPAAENIVAISKEENADLIVIATHGRSGIKNLLFGSVAEKVVRTAECPVLTIKRELQD